MRVHLGKANLSTFARITEMVAELEQGHGDAEKQMMQMRENNNELQDEMKKAKEAWAKERNELAEAASREKGNLKAANKHLIAAMTAPELSFVTMAVQCLTAHKNGLRHPKHLNVECPSEPVEKVVRVIVDKLQNGGYMCPGMCFEADLKIPNSSLPWISIWSSTSWGLG